MEKVLYCLINTYIFTLFPLQELQNYKTLRIACESIFFFLFSALVSCVREPKEKKRKEKNDALVG